MRALDELRPVKITPNFLTNPPGSCLIEMGGTRVVCSAFIDNSVPQWLKGSGAGWLTAEYGMLPASSSQRIRRERNQVGGRTQEIQRLIGRSLRNCIDLKKLGERSILIDCDVIDADGGTRTASITGGYVALVLALKKVGTMIPDLRSVIRTSVAAVSVGMVHGKAYFDLDYTLDKEADVDMNVVKTGENKYCEVQGTGEQAPFSSDQLQTLLKLADKGIAQLFTAQNEALKH